MKNKTKTPAEKQRIINAAAKVMKAYILINTKDGAFRLQEAMDELFEAFKEDMK